MKITVPIDVHDPRRGGAERYLSRLTGSLTSRGHRVHILCLVDRQSADESLPAGCTVETLEPPFAARRLRSLRELWFAREGLRRHRASDRDLLYAFRHALEADVYQPHGGSYRTAPIDALAGAGAVRRGLKRVTRLLRPTTHALRWLDGQVFRRSPGLITMSLSEVVEDSFRRAYPGVSFRFERIPNGIPLEEFHDRDREALALELRERIGADVEAPVALFLAHQFRAKGLDFAIEAVSRLSSWHLVVGGRGRVEPHRLVARRLGVESRVHFLGEIADPRRLYAAADAFLLPTWYDSCALSVLEAIACGTPAVTTRRNGAAELYESGGEGFVVDSPRDVGGWVRALECIDADRSGFRERARQLAPSLSWEQHVDRIEEVLERRHRELQADLSAASPSRRAEELP